MGSIRLEGISKRFGDNTVLSAVTLDVRDGEFVALLGASGCGKSTLLRIVAGIEAADSGHIQIAGRDVSALRAAERDVAMVFQSYALYPHLTVRQNIAVPLTMRRLSAWQRLPWIGTLLPGAKTGRREIVEEVEKAAAAFGLGPLLERRPGQLSGGQRQRTALARAVVRRPEVFLMDEPLSNLDASLRAQARQEIVDIHRRVGAATLYVTHDQAEALTMADRVALMQGGQLLQVADPKTIYHDPANLDVARFIGSPKINTLGGEIHAGRVRVGGRFVGLLCEAADGPVTVGVRPEDLTPEAEGLPATLLSREFCGDTLLVYARLAADGGTVAMRLPPAWEGAQADGRSSAERLHLAFDPRRALVFAADGRRLPAQAVARNDVAHV